MTRHSSRTRTSGIARTLRGGATAALALALLAPLAAGGALRGGAPASAPSPPANGATAAGPTGPLATRAELEAAASRAGGEAAAAIRERLRTGDFRVGDKIHVRTPSSLNLPEQLAQTLNDTATVREGRVLRWPDLGELPLDGVLRSELQQVVTQHLSKYLRDPDVRVQPLMQVLVSGPIRVPGYHWLPPDLLLADVYMRVGPPSTGADLNKSRIRRDGEDVVSRDSLRVAVRNGVTLDRLGLQSGDELEVGERTRRNWLRYVSAISTILGLVWVVIRITDRR